MTIDLSYMLDVLPSILSYLPVTLELALFSMVIGVVLGLFLALVRFTKVPVLNQIAAVYISLFRGMPTLVQLFLIYYGLPQLFPELTKLDALTAAIIGFGLKEASYLAEIFRASLNSVDRGQYEAGLAVGLTGSRSIAASSFPRLPTMRCPQPAMSSCLSSRKLRSRSRWASPRSSPRASCKPPQVSVSSKLISSSASFTGVSSSSTPGCNRAWSAAWPSPT